MSFLQNLFHKDEPLDLTALNMDLKEDRIKAVESIYGRIQEQIANGKITNMLEMQQALDKEEQKLDSLGIEDKLPLRYCIIEKREGDFDLDHTNTLKRHTYKPAKSPIYRIYPITQVANHVEERGGNTIVDIHIHPTKMIDFDILRGIKVIPSREGLKGEILASGYIRGDAHPIREIKTAKELVNWTKTDDLLEGPKALRQLEEATKGTEASEFYHYFSHTDWEDGLNVIDKCDDVQYGANGFFHPAEPTGGSMDEPEL